MKAGAGPLFISLEKSPNLQIKKRLRQKLTAILKHARSPDMTVGISYINFNTGPFGGVRSIMQVPIISPIFRPSPAVMVLMRVHWHRIP